MIKKHFYNTEEVAEHLSVSISAIRKWIRTGQIPFTRINGAIRFDIDEIQKWTMKNKCSIHHV